MAQGPHYERAAHGHLQEMPRLGGYETLKYKRNLPIRGPSGAIMFAACASICAFGFYRVGQGKTELRELNREKAWSRLHLVPLLLAEQDRDAYRRQEASNAREAAIMKDVPGWEAGKSVYHTKRYTPPSIVVL